MPRSENDSSLRAPSKRVLNLLERERWVAFDTETTGLEAEAEIVEFAVVDSAGRVQLSSRVRPCRAISPGAVRLHGLDEENLVSAPGFREIYPSLSETLAGHLVIAYNGAFDRRALATTCAVSECPEIIRPWLCALDLFESLRGFRPPLHIACEIEGVEPPEPAHRATADALALFRLVTKLRCDVNFRRFFDN